MPDDQTFEYVAVDSAGRRVKGQANAASDSAVFDKLKRDGLSPIRIQSARPLTMRRTGAGRLSDVDAAELFSDLAALLGAGVDIRAALSVVGGRSRRPNMAEACRSLSTAISGGEGLESAFSARLGRRQGFASVLLAAGEAAGDLTGGFRRSAEVLESRIKLKDQLIGAISYPAFVLISTIAALLVILLFVVPSLAPLAESGSGSPPLVLAVLIGVSEALRGHLLLIAGGLAIGLVSAVLAARAGLLEAYVDRALLSGPIKRTVCAIVFGGFAIALGGMLSAGAPMSDALRLSVRAAGSRTARQRLEFLPQAIRQGSTVSQAMDRVDGMPETIVRLAAVGEASGSLGAMLLRAGKMEEAAGLRRIEAAGRLLGPLLIVVLGGVIGLIMAGLLTGVSSLGQTVLE